MAKKLKYKQLKSKASALVFSLLEIAKQKPIHVSILFISASLLLFSVYKILNDLVFERIFAAGDTSVSWDFSNSGDYTLSDTNVVEISNNQGRLKTLNYTSDANTSLLLHLDESSGSPVDSSSNANTATATNVTYSPSGGKLLGSAAFNGSTSEIKISDSTSISTTGSQTLEGWVKLNTDFSAGSRSRRHGILDKGDYQLYFNNETGKLVYEIADSTANTWTQVAANMLNGSWDHSGKANIESSTVMNGNYYVGTGNSTSDGEVWMWNGTTWSKIGGDGLNSSWAVNTNETVQSMTNDGTYVYAGLGVTAGDAEVWRWDGLNWLKIGGDGINSGWAAGFESVHSLYSQGGTIYAGLGASANDAEVWAWNGTSWLKIGGDSVNSGWTTNFEWVYSLTGDGTNIYAGLGSTAGDAEVWRWNGTSWLQIGGDAVNSSWANSTYETVYTMTYYGGNLYAGLGVSANDAEVWRWNGSSWLQIGGDSLNNGWTTNYEGVYSLANDGTNLYAGLGLSTGDNELWRWNGTDWTKIGGDGLDSSFTNTHTIVNTLNYSSGVLYAGVNSGNNNYSAQAWTYNAGTWTLIGGDKVNYSWGTRGLRSVDVLNVSGDVLYAGTGYGTAGNALVWAYDGSTWSFVGGQGVANSWAPNLYEDVLSMISHNGDLYVGLGTTAGDAEVWHYNGTTWQMIGGDGVNNGWGAGYEEVTSLASSNQTLYAGLGASSGDAEIYSWDGNEWTKIAGDNLNGGWNTGYERVTAMVEYQGNLYAGLGSSAGDAEVWVFSGGTWSRIGGDGVGWANSTYEQVDSMITYGDKLAVGLGTSTGDAEVWTYDGTSWTMIGGDDVNSSWTDAIYERVRTLVVYNGNLYAGLGNSAGDGEVWEWNGTTWVEIGGDNINSGWSISIEEINAFSIYRGALYVGMGNTANADANIWKYGNNAYLASSQTSWTANTWYHIAGIYNGSSLSLYVNGVLSNTLSASRVIPDSSRDLLIGATYAGREYGKPRGTFDGSLDEIRISNIARSPSSLITGAYSTSAQTIQPSSPVMTTQIKNWNDFNVTEGGVGTVTYRLSDNGGTSWKYWDGSAWVASSSTSEANDATTVSTNLSTFPVTTSGILWQAILLGNGDQQVSVSSVEITATADTTAPSIPDILVSKDTNGGSDITTDTWYPHSGPYFSWSGSSDGSGSGISGYYVYFGTTAGSTPSTAGTFQAGTTFTASNLISGSTYYLRIQVKDNAGNISPVWSPFTYKFDNTLPTNPNTITVNPSGYAANNNFTFSWPAGSDSGSNIAGYQYKTGASTGSLADWSATITERTVTIPDAAYKSDDNKFYLRTLDNAGNTTTQIEATYYFAGDGPSAPQFVAVYPSSNTTNSFAFSWQAPESYSGNVNELTYCYTVNTLPSANSCTFTSAGATSLSASAFATQVGLNTFYVVAKNPALSGGTINYGAYSTVTFTANTSAPGIPLNIDIADISIKSTSTWRLTVSWNSPEDVGSGVSTYQVYRSEDGSSYEYLANTSGSAYVDTGLLQQTYYYKVKACDNVNNCGAFTSEVSMLPTGKFTEPATLDKEPTVTNITTKKATISWSTNRTSDTKVQYGTSSGSYFDEEPSNSAQVAAHTISLSNLSPGTTYYFKAKWTDEDGNTGISKEYNFKTEPAPVIKDVAPKSVGINSTLLQFTISGASKVKIYYGESTAFGGIQEVTTSTAEATYTALISDLKDGTKYYYKLAPFDVEGAEYDNQINSFETLPKPKIADVTVQQVKGTAQPTVLISWTTNTETSSIITYYPENNPAEARDEVNVSLINGAHKMLLRGLKTQTTYALIVKARDAIGNEVSSDINRFTTSTDTRPPLISDLKIEGGVIKSGDGSQLAQLIVSWNTDEPATSQVEYGEGTGTNYSQKTQSDTNLTYNHLVVISGLQTSKAYHLRAISTDQTGNTVNSIDNVTITPKATDNALDLVISNLQEAFGFLGDIN